MKIASFVSLFFLLGTCALPPPDIDTDSPDSYLERVNAFLSEGNNLRAIPLILAHERDGYAEQDRYESAINGLRAEWRAAEADKDWLKSLVYLRSFKALGEEFPVEGVSEKQLLLQGVKAHIASGFMGAAAALLQNNFTADELSKADRDELAGVFKDAGYRLLTAMLESAPPPESPDIGTLIDGTVTVWVNRGMRLEGSVGVPDSSVGSGFFIDPEGYLLTNYHVIDSEVDPAYQGYSKLYIKIDDESRDRIPAKVVGWDKNLDIALLKTEMDVPYVYSFSNQDIPKLGDKISAIGSPGGLARTLTSGTVSAYFRSIQPMVGSLQIDVPINPGNSGGPLLNSRGEVIGVVFAGVPEFEGINFAIPGEYVLRILPALYEDGPIAMPWLGAAAWDNKGKIEITYIVPHSPAADAGLQPGDIILSLGGESFETVRKVQEYLVSQLPGTLLTLAWQRNDEGHEGIAALGVRPDIPMREALSMDAREHLLYPLFGFSVERISGHGFTQNYRILSILPGSIADEAGFSVGDAIAIRRWQYVREAEAVVMLLQLKGRKAGFLESSIQIASYLNINTVF
ncbi:MAG: hypothetical protein B0D92_02730 [Spirochaeta sp. LUC14_002_19_P3]|nr:MAG: hypothetical protein B0D92_02730 [Spirochaeta sp. LUC14_002_19_P3]